MKGAAMGAAALAGTRQSMTKPVVSKQDPGRPSVDNSHSLKPVAAKPDVNGDAAAKTGDAAAAEADQKKKAKVKDFYSNLLSKKKTDKHAAPKTAAGPETEQAPAAAPNQEGQ